MKAMDLKTLRQQLGLTQQEMARALDVSFATLNRWEKGHRVIPHDIAKLIESTSVLVNEAAKGQGELTPEEIREAILAAGIRGVVSSAAVSGFLPKAILLGLAAAVPGFIWITGALGVGVLGALSFFRKSRIKKQESDTDDAN